MKTPATNTQNGLAVLEVLLIVSLILLLVGVASYVYTRNHHGALPFIGTKSTPVSYNGSSGSTSPNGIPGGATGNTQNSNQPANLTTVTVPEGRFTLKVPDSLKDLTYHVSTANGVTTISFSTKQLTAAVPACAADQKNGAFDRVVRGSGQYPGPAPDSGGLLVQGDGYYLAYILPNAPCAKNMSPANQSLADQQAQDFYSALSTIKAY